MKALCVAALLVSSRLDNALSFTSPPILSQTWAARFSNVDSFKAPPIASPTCLHSLNRLVEEVCDRSPGDPPSIVFVGGKGGVGKTTVSSALAVSLASALDKNVKVLIVSTDPAHSLGDALDEDLRKGKGQPLPMTDPVTGGRLDACEIDASSALDELRSNIETFDVDRLADALGVQPELLESFGLREFSGILNSPPPGLDEIVALGNVLDPKSVMAEGYDVVIVDTAPTGHTLRLLDLPQFLDGLLGKLIKIRLKLSGLTSTLQSFFGSSDSVAQQRTETIDTAVNKLDAFRVKMSGLKSRLQDAESTRFVVVTIPTKLGVAESKRLVAELGSQGVKVTDVVVNQCVDDPESGETTAMENYYNRRRTSQDRWIQKLEDTATDVSNSKEYKSNSGGGSPEPIHVTKVPFFDVELVGVPALGYLGSQCFTENAAFDTLMNDFSSVGGEPRVVICGGKGGVGKTTTSASLAVSMAGKGHKVALISTDPAHSVGDAFDSDFRGGKLVDVPLIGVPTGGNSEGSLSVMEIDPAEALAQFKGVIDQLVGGKDEDDSSESSGLKNTLRDLQDIFATLPAGTDEVVALAKIVNLVKKGGFDRIVLDTAPTGHTLRMLSTPGFLAELIDRVLKISDKINSNSAVKLLIGTSGRSEDISNAVATSKSTLLSFQLQMYDLEDLFADADQTEFLIVTVPTELAVRESTRLLNELTFGSPDMPIKCRNIVANQVLENGDAQSFLSHLSQTQSSSIKDLEATISTSPAKPEVTKIGYLDTEPRGVFGLKALADELMRH